MKTKFKFFGTQGKSLCAVALAALMASALAFIACASDPAPVAPASGLDELSRALRSVSDYLNDTIPSGSMVVFMNVQSDFEQLSDFIIDELLANAVNDRVFTVVDRHQLDVIRVEQNLQLSGEVDDETALSVGRFLGAQMIVSGRISSLGGHYRLTIRALEVETARLQGQYNQNIGTVATIGALMGAGARTAQAPAQRAGQVPTQQTAQVPGQRAAQVPAQQAPPPPPPPIVGTVVPGDSLSEKLAWLQRSANSHGTYILEVRNDETIAPHRFEFRGAINITIVLRGVDENRTIRLGSNGTMFTVRRDVTLILDNNITLQGHGQNNRRLVSVEGGIFRMNTGSIITGNTGGGVLVSNRGTFEMNGGTISSNVASRGGGVLLNTGGNFTMTNGAISNNTANTGGGGVNTGTIGGAGTFNMRGGIITDNTAHEDGGGVLVQWGNFTMHGGTISSNTAATAGGGVRVGGDFGRGVFEKRGGTITGYGNDPSNGNVVRDGDGVLARRGHAVFAGSNRSRETTVGPSVQLNSGRAGGWDS